MWENIKGTIDLVIKTNNNQEITGAVLNSLLKTIVDTVGAPAIFAGLATPNTNPGTPDGPVFYFATEAGTYSNFNVAVVQEGLTILKWDGSSWTAISVLDNSVVAAIQALIPVEASTNNQLADKNFVNSTVATSTATFRGNYNLVTDLGLTTSATQAQISTALTSTVDGADNNDYVFVQIPTSSEKPTEIIRIERYKFNGTEWRYEYSLNNSGFTASQWAAINSGINSSLVFKLSQLPDVSAMQAALNSKQNVIQDLAEIRAGAQAGETAVQPSALNEFYTKQEVDSKVADAGNTDKLVRDLGGYEEEPETITLFQGSLSMTTKTIDCYIEVGDELQIELDDSADYINLRTNSEVIYYKQGGTVQTNNIVNGVFTATKRATNLLVTGYSQSSAIITQDIEKLHIVSEVESLQGVQSEVDELVDGLGGVSIYENTLIDNQQGSTSEKTVPHSVKAGQQFRIIFSGNSSYVLLRTDSETIYRKVGGTVRDNKIVDSIFTATSDATKFMYASYSGLSFTVIALENRIGIVSGVEDNAENIGNLDELETENTDDLVSAINEVNRNLPEQEDVTQYVVMRGGGNGTGTEPTYPWNIKKGDKFVIFRDDTGDVSYCVVKSYLNGNQVQEFVRYTGGNPQGSGRLGVEIEATGNADSFGISSYGKYSITTTVKKMNVEVEVEKRLINRLYGKRWLLIGDSISTEGSSWAVKGYGHYISQSLGMYYMNIAVGGKTMQWGCQQVPNQDNNYDLITVMLGTNNEGYNMGIGNINDAPDASSTAYIPATKAMIELLRAKYPKSVIIFITPIRRCNVDEQGNVNNRNVALKQYVDALIEVCNLYCVPVIDLWNTIAPEIDSIRSLFFCGTHEAGSDQDGTHPNELGHQMLLAPVIEDGIIKHSQFYFNDWSNQQNNA